MRGPSANALEFALPRTSGPPPHLNAKLLNHTSINFPPQLRKQILRVAEQQPVSAGDLSQLNFRLGETFAETALTACRRFRIAPKKITLIGSHVQTIFHQAPAIPSFARPTTSTVQLGQASTTPAR